MAITIMSKEKLAERITSESIEFLGRYEPYISNYRGDLYNIVLKNLVFEGQCVDPKKENDNLIGLDSPTY